jgi:hypothetical protein
VQVFYRVLVDFLGRDHGFAILLGSPVVFDYFAFGAALSLFEELFLFKGFAHL